MSHVTSLSPPPTPSRAGYLPNSSLAVEAMLATASLGAIWTSTSPDFGITVRSIYNLGILKIVARCHGQGVLDRLSQVRPKVIFSVEAVRYNAKTHDHLKKLISVVAGKMMAGHRVKPHPLFSRSPGTEESGSVPILRFQRH